MEIPHFPESNHLLVQWLSHYSDRELLALFRRYPEQGKYFTAIFCRYSPIVYTLISHSARSPVQANYLFALTWRQLFSQMGGLTLGGEGDAQSHSFQTWLIDLTAVYIQQAELPSAESINYDLKTAAPPLWCYLEQALELLPPMIRTRSPGCCYCCDAWRPPPTCPCPTSFCGQSVQVCLASALHA